jgi:hypothetical protein
MMHRILYFLLLLPAGLAAQSVIRGRVTEASGGKAVAGASIFISNTSRGTITNEKGEFTLTEVPSGRYVLVISSVGFQTDLETIDSRYPRKEFDIALRTKVSELGEVTVRAFDKDGYKRWGELFRENFIGTSDYARNCRILNPESIKIHFAPKSRVLTAYSDGPILVENRSLGYEVQVTLESFRYELSTTAVSISIFPLFTEMQGTSAKVARWERNRAVAYYGSSLHFFRSLYHGRAQQEGFSVKMLSPRDSVRLQRLKAGFRQTLATARDSAGPDGGGLMPEALLGKDLLAQYDDALENARNVGGNLMYPGEPPMDRLVVARDSNVMVMDFDLFLQVTYLRSRAPDRYYADFVIDPARPESGRRVNIGRNALGGMTTRLDLFRGLPMEVFSNGSYYNTDLIFEGYWNWWQKIGNLLPYDYTPPPASVPKGPPYP